MYYSALGCLGFHSEGPTFFENLILNLHTVAWYQMKGLAEGNNFCYNNMEVG